MYTTVVLLRTSKTGYQTNLHPADEAYTLGRSGGKFLPQVRATNVIYIYIYTHTHAYIYINIYPSPAPPPPSAARRPPTATQAAAGAVAAVRGRLRRWRLQRHLQARGVGREGGWGGGRERRGGVRDPGGKRRMGREEGGRKCIDWCVGGWVVAMLVAMLLPAFDTFAELALRWILPA